MLNCNLILVRGIPGSGKSTFCKTLPDFIHFEADMFFVKNGEYQFDATLVSAAHDWCIHTVNILLNNNKNIVVANTFTRRWEMKPYIDIAMKLDINVQVYRMTKEYGNVHGVSEEVMDKMRKRFEDYPNEILINFNL